MASIEFCEYTPIDSLSFSLARQITSHCPASTDTGQRLHIHKRTEGETNAIVRNENTNPVSGNLTIHSPSVLS